VNSTVLIAMAWWTKIGIRLGRRVVVRGKSSNEQYILFILQGGGWINRVMTIISLDREDLMKGNGCLSYFGSCCIGG